MRIFKNPGPSFNPVNRGSDNGFITIILQFKSYYKVLHQISMKLASTHKFLDTLLTKLGVYSLFNWFNR
jgi:hypothetical protein